MNKKYIDFVPVSKTSQASHFTPKKSEIVSAKAKDIKAKSPVQKVEKVAKKPVKNPVEKPVEKSVEKSDDDKMKIPKYPFINQEKVKKRPLSKNVYKKEIKAPVEEPQGPVTIISKPEKDTHASLVVTIILTIILGAAAGTVAFLLLPK